jgi:hypothetical protein
MIKLTQALLFGWLISALRWPILKGKHREKWAFFDTD